MPRKQKKLLRQVVLEEGEIYHIGCLRCGLKEGEGPLLYPYPMVKGTLWCPKCSPAWLKSFLDSATANQQRAMNGAPAHHGHDAAQAEMVFDT